MSSSRIRYLLLAATLVLSLGLRLHAIDEFLVGDETKWICRSISFHKALARRDLASTYQSEHPGVVTMWLGALAVPLADAGDWIELCEETDGSKLTRVRDHDVLSRLPLLIYRARRLVAVATWLGIIAIYVLLRRLVTAWSAVCATMLVALDPFYLALSRVLHLDALLATFMALSMLSLLVYRRDSSSKRYLVVSAISGGLAIANKSPGLFLLPWLALVLGTDVLRSERARRRQCALRALADLTRWGGLALLVVFVLWPALWVEPIDTVGKVLSAAIGYAEEPHGSSNYFWFMERPDPGVAFYPVAWAFRTTPGVLLGLLSLSLSRRAGRGVRIPWGLGALAVLYGAFMTVGAKKFDRYLLPSVVLLDMLAGVGLGGLPGWLGSPSLRRLEARRFAPATLAMVLFLSQAGLIWPRQPYYFSYYNPVLGGTTLARQILLVGWGEGLERAAAYLNGKPGSERFHVNTAHISQFAPFFVGHTSSANELDLAESDYYVFYWNTIQRHRVPEALDRFYGIQPPEHIVQVDGIDYVWIYANTLFEPVLEFLDSQGDAEHDILLLDVDSALARHYDRSLKMVSLNGSAPEDDIVRELANATEGRRNVWYLTFWDTPGDPRGLIHGHLGDQATQTGAVSFDGMVLTRYTLNPGARFEVPAPSIPRLVQFAEKIRLVGYDVPETTVSPGEVALFRLYWQAESPVDVSYTVFAHLLSRDGARVGQDDGKPAGGTRPTSEWLVGETVVDERRIQIDDDAPPGEYRLAVGLYHLASGERLPAVSDDGLFLPESRVLLEGLEISQGPGNER